jgi:short subunit dehydrogenase-like uncharacterized protein
MTGDLAIYGSYGYTGDLIVEAARDRGMEPLLVGRNRDRLTDQGIRHDCDTVVADVDEPKVLEMAFEDATAVLNCGGPFVDTATQILGAALRTGTAYLDITGEIDVFETLADRDSAARDAGIPVVPGVGFDVVPTDCLAAHLADRLPGATELTLAFDTGGGMSRGTARTSLRMLPAGLRVRRDEDITAVPWNSIQRTVDFGWGHDERHATAIPWGDVATAWHTTGIPDIEVLQSTPPRAARIQGILGRLAPLLTIGPVRRVAEWLIDRRVAGPDADTRASEHALVWGEARTEDGERVVSRLRCPEAYATTVETALNAAERVLDGGIGAGFDTPGGAFGPEFILAVAGTEREDVV